MTDVRLDYTSVGGNRHPAAADWDRSTGIIAFGADNNVALWEPLDETTRGIFALLKGHNEAVNAIRFITPACLNESLIVSGSVDKTIKVWRRSQNEPLNWRLAASLEGHTSSINCITELSAQSIFVTGAADGTVRVWQIRNSESGPASFSVTPLHEITLTPKFFPLAVAIAALDSPTSQDSKELVLAVAGTRATIQIYVAKGSSDTPNAFSLVATLTGHEAWIRSLAITYESLDDASSDLLIASASQDKYIRLWRVHRGEDIPTSSRALDDPTLGVLAKSSLSNKAHRFSTISQSFSITFEALLLGHEDWIYTTSWHRFSGRLQLLSASADNSLAVWEADESTGIWTCVARLGEISAQKGSTSATGSTGGFWLGLWSPSADAVVSLGRTGGWRLWQRDNAGDADKWTQKPAVTGHTRSVNDIAWSRDGAYLLSTSNDQTTRLHAEWKRNSSSSEGTLTSWHEFSRPQIHGYDLNCIDTITDSQFVSGADEKLLRVFDEPDGVAEMLHTLCGIAKPTGATLPDAANIPVLGLSNKAIDTTADTQETSNDQVSSTTAPNVQTSTPPLEDHLARHLLWPELEKLYGHGYEISVLAASHSGHVVATACRASSTDHAVIRLFSTAAGGWREIKPALKAHALTVTSLRFSADDEWLLSVGRDRVFCLWRRGKESAYELMHKEEKAHSRMILAGDWAPGSERIFATGGRDKVFRIWKLSSDLSVKCLQTLAADVPITALAFAPSLFNADQAILAVGLEDGSVDICSVNLADPECKVRTLSLKEPRALYQSKSISQLLWRPTRPSEAVGAESVWQLAISSTDSSLHVFSITLSQ